MIDFSHGVGAYLLLRFKRLDFDLLQMNKTLLVDF